ncbi:MAG: DUF1343 domain-containing protein [Isosphaeraceae bacterium]|nr:DUF1343 domain-containing protein [Isosphaeraceae bacterium]
MTPRVAFGIDRLVDDRFARLRGRRIGLIANQTTVDRRMRHLADLLHAEPGVELVALFGPEHGIRGDAQDMIGVDRSIDARTGVVSHSLYGDSFESLTPSAEQLDGIDMLIFDVQDVGSRYYTFAATMAYAMRAAAERGIAFLVLDRPNPIGGAAIEGPSITAGHASFVGFHPMPIRHGLTVGEIARLYASEPALDLDLEVVPCTGWRRTMLWDDLDRPWINPSPNMPSPDTALVYPGGCIVEGTSLSEGRGTTRPFEFWGGPDLDPDRILEIALELLGELAAGAIPRVHGFRPTFHKHRDRLCLGVQPMIVDAERFRPVAWYTAMLAAARISTPHAFVWRTEPYEFVADPIAVDLLYGSPRERIAIDEGLDADRFRSLVEVEWRRDEHDFRERRLPHLLYFEADW